jgi:hypothetical protein
MRDSSAGILPSTPKATSNVLVQKARTKNIVSFFRIIVEENGGSTGKTPRYNEQIQARRYGLLPMVVKKVGFNTP